MIPGFQIRNANSQDPLLGLAEAGHDQEFQKYITINNPSNNLFNIHLVELALKKNFIEFKPETKVCNILEKIFEINPDIHIPLSFVKKYCFTKDMQFNIEFYRIIKSKINMKNVDTNEAYEYCKFAIESRVTSLFVDARDLLKKLNHLQILELQKINYNINKNILTKKRIVHKCLQKFRESKQKYIIKHLYSEGLWIKLHSLDKLATLMLKTTSFDKFYSMNISIDKTLDKAFEFLKCPISQEIFIEPIITPLGHTFDRKNIIKLVTIGQSNDTDFFKCPFTRSSVLMKDCFNIPALRHLCNILVSFYEENHNHHLRMLESKQQWMRYFIEKVVYTYNYFNMLFFCWEYNKMVDNTSYRFVSGDEKLFATVNIHPEQKLYRFRLAEDLFPLKKEFYENVSEFVKDIKKITRDTPTFYISETDTDDDCKIVDTTTINQQRNKL